MLSNARVQVSPNNVVLLISASAGAEVLVSLARRSALCFEVPMDGVMHTDGCRVLRWDADVRPDSAETVFDCDVITITVEREKDVSLAVDSG